MKTTSNICQRLIIAVCALILISHSVVADDWSQWRGNRLDNIAEPNNAIPIEFNANKNQKWRVEMPGPGGSSPIVRDGRVFVTSVAGDGIVLVALSTGGDELWRQQLGGKNRQIRMDNANSASPSPFTDGTHVWATNSEGFLHCFTVTGEPVWSKDLQKEYGAFDIQFGLSTTPVLDNGRIYHHLIHGNMRASGPGTAIILCLDAATGNEIWRQSRDSDAYAENKHAYTSPTIYRDADQEFLVVHASDYITGHAFDDGRELWRCGGFNLQGEKYHPTLRLVSSAACVPGLIVVPTAKNGPVFTLKPPLSGDVTDSIQWRLERSTPDVATPVIHDGLIYLATEGGSLACVDAVTGEEDYRKRMYADRHRSTPVVVGDRMYITARDGKVLVVKTGLVPELLATNDLGEETTASPAVSAGRLFIRTNAALYCFGE